MARLTLQLFGGLCAYRESGADAAAAGRKANALLAYLALNPKQRCTRDRIATLLWSDRGEEQARHSLRQALLSLRKALDDESASILVSDGDRLTLDPEAIAVDVQAFERLAASRTREALEQAGALYVGDFLDGIDVRSEGFEEWLAAERTRLRDLAADVLLRLTQIYMDGGEWDAAGEAAQRLLALDPSREEGHRILMRLYERTGRRSLALRQYRICEDSLRRELDAAPAPETDRLHAEIRARDEERTAGVENSNGIAGERRLPHGIEVAAAPGPSSSSAGNGARMAAASTQPLGRGSWLWAAAAVAVIVAAAALWALYLRGPATTAAADTAKMAFPLPEKPSIAVLPFENQSGDPSQDSFVDALTGDVTTALSIMSEMFVIDRYSTLIYRSKPATTKQVAEALGVRYVLEGSVQKSGDRIRVTVELIDAVTGHHIWADRYDREITDVFALRDEITLAVVTALQVHITEGEQERISLIHGTHNLQAWVLAGRGLQSLRRLTQGDNARARELYQAAAALDPNYPGAWDGLAWSHLLDARFGWSGSPEADLGIAAELAEKALALDPERSRSYALVGSIGLMTGDFAQAVASGEKAVALDPNGAEVAALLAFALTYTGDIERSIALLNKAMRLSPYYPGWYRWTLGRAYRLAGRYQEAEAALVASEGGAGSVLPLVELAAVYSETGRLSEARAEAAEILTIDPKFSVLAWVKIPPHQDPARTRREIDTLRRAGLPD